MRLGTGTRATVQAWINKAAPIVGLAEWKITVAADAAAEDAWADIEPHSTDPRATLRIGSSFEEQSANRQREILTHELMHLHVHALDRYTSSLEESHGRIWYGGWYPGYEALIEQACERLAQVFAPQLPPYRTRGGRGQR